jgi:hypothetical protein
MKISKRIALALIVIFSASYFASGQTLKERIDEAKVVKVYFKNAPISHVSNYAGNSTMNIAATGCETFGETTPLTQEYLDALNGLIETLNTGFNTTAFVAGDFSAVPERTSGILKGEPDWVAVGEPLMFFISSSGQYNVKLESGKGKQNRMEISSSITVYTINGDKVKILGQKLLASVWSDPIQTQKCDDYAYFVEQFPTNSLLEPFKAELNENIKEFIEKDMKKYEKEMSKKK